ncbi:hypothetical protein MBLNU13_g11106t1 [Cladosporium sp. NU13]
MSFMKTAALLGSLAASAYAHGRVISIEVDGTEYEGFTSAQASSGKSDGIAWSASNQDNGFVGPESYGTSDIACHKDGKPGAKVASVAAGGSIKLQWDTWPESHHGPVLDYLAKCAGDDCTSVSAGDLSFFKIDEKGLNDAASNSWASDDLIKDGNSWTVTVPEDIAPGQYVLRHEIIALHSAQDANGAQNYPQCINIEVTGSGTAEPAGVAATELYTAKDAGISLNIYNGLTGYEIPGPAVYSGGASSGSSGSTPKPSSAAASSAAATSAAASSAAATSAPATSAAASSSAPQQTGEAGSDSSAPCTTTITITGSAPAATATATEVATETAYETATATATGSPVDTSSDDGEYEQGNDGSSGSAPSTTAAAPAISAVASSLPSSVLDAPIPTATSTTDKEDGRPSKALPEGFTLKDLLEWVNYLISKAYNADGKHARDVTRR